MSTQYQYNHEVGLSWVGRSPGLRRLRAKVTAANEVPENTLIFYIKPDCTEFYSPLLLRSSVIPAPLRLLTHHAK